MNPGDQFHVGIVVDDLDAALDRARHAARPRVGSRGGRRAAGAPPGRCGAGPVPLPLLAHDAAPRGHPGPAGHGLDARAGSGIHHLGRWSDDVVGDGDRLVAAGYALEAAGEDAQGTRSWAYHRSPAGPRIELVSRDLEAAMAGLWA